MPRFLLILVTVLTLLAAACGSDETTLTAADGGDGSDNGPGEGSTAGDGTAGDDAAGGGATRAWIGGDWVLTDATVDGAPLALPDAVVLDLKITGPDLVQGNGGCNSFGGVINAPFGDGPGDAGPVSFADLAMTEMACEPFEILEFESVYVRALSSTTEWELSPPANLILRGDGIELVYGLGEPPVQTALEQTVWTFDTIFDGEGVERTASTPRMDKAPVTAVIADGSITFISEDCGKIGFAINYEPGSEGNVAVPDPAAAVASCDDPDSNMIPAVAGVAEATGYMINESRLTFIGLPGETVSFRAEG